MRAWFRYLVLWLVRLWHLVQGWLWPGGTHRRWRQCRATTPARRVRAHPKSKWVRDEIIRLKALMPDAGCRLIAHHFQPALRGPSADDRG